MDSRLYSYTVSNGLPLNVDQKSFWSLTFEDLMFRPLEERLVGRNDQLILSLVGEFDFGQAAMRKDCARGKHVA